MDAAYRVSAAEVGQVDVVSMAVGGGHHTLGLKCDGRFDGLYAAGEHFTVIRRVEGEA